ILMYDVTNGKLLRTITDAHPPGTAVLHIKFTDDPTLAVCNDSGGSVFELNFRRLMGVRSCESRCLFSGSRGEVCAIQTLHLNKNIADHPLRDRHMLAMGTLTKVGVKVIKQLFYIKVLIEFYRNVVPICVNHCLHIGRVDVLFGRIYERFRVDCVAHGAFLECLEPYILNNQLQSISPEVMQDFVTHYQAKGMLSNVESCLLHLDVSSLDLHQVLHLCWAHGLYDAIISIHNRSMKDYLGPLFELLSILEAALGTGAPLSEKMTNLGNKLLVYVSCCLAGVGYPHGVLDEETSTRLKKEVIFTYQILLYLIFFQQFVDILLQVMLESQGFKALVELLQCGFIKMSYTQRLVHLAEQASFYKVLRFLHTQQRRFDLVFVAHIRDPAESENAFAYIQDILTNPSTTDQEKETLKNKVLEHIKDLININGKKSVNLVTTSLQGTIQTIAAKLHVSWYLFLYLVCSLSYEESTYDAPNPSNDPDTCELYLSLMCQFNRGQVVAFIQECEACRPHKALEIVRRYRVDSATAYLLEKSGDVSAAFNILLSVANEKIKLLNEVNLYYSDDGHLHLQEVMSSVDDVIGLCQRNSSKLQEKQREKLWFSLLDVVLKPQYHLVDSDDHEDVKQLAQRVLTSMIGHMTLPAVLQKIIQDPAYRSGKFGEIRSLLLGMLETYQYERTLLNTTLQLLARHRHTSMSNLHRNVVRGVSPKSQYCLVC
uniref:Uncharacterized protein n=1 Tax=Ciona savignyi TaxID=51511 RepID=H2ZCD3_CIOSA